MNIRIDDGNHAAVKKLAGVTGQKIGWIVNQAVGEYVKGKLPRGRVRMFREGERARDGVVEPRR